MFKHGTYIPREDLTKKTLNKTGLPQKNTFHSDLEDS